MAPRRQRGASHTTWGEWNELIRFIAALRWESGDEEADAGAADGPCSTGNHSLRPHAVKRRGASYHGRPLLGPLRSTAAAIAADYGEGESDDKQTHARYAFLASIGAAAFAAASWRSEQRRKSLRRPPASSRGARAMATVRCGSSRSTRTVRTTSHRSTGTAQARWAGRSDRRQGAKGATGERGPIGATGAKGATGATGPVVNRGNRRNRRNGRNGEKGATGAKAPGRRTCRSIRCTGATGAQLSEGDTGATVHGRDGCTGRDRAPRVTTGPTGATGAAAPRAPGVKGDKGDAGADGTNGTNGVDGTKAPTVRGTGPWRERCRWHQRDRRHERCRWDQRDRRHERHQRC